jgi:hypothetical protein
MKYTILTILLFALLTSCGNAQKKDNQIESEYIFKKAFCKEIVVGGAAGIENKCYNVNDVITGTLQSNDYIKVRLRPYVNEDETGLTQDQINERRRLSSQEFIEIPIDYFTLKVENKVEKETKEFLSKNKPEQKVKLGNIVEIRIVNQKSSYGTDIVWKNKSTCKLVKQIETNCLSRKEDSEGEGGFTILRFKTEQVGTENIIIDQCRIYPNSVYKNCLGEQKFSIEIVPKGPLSKEVPPNGMFIFTVKDFEASKTGKWKVIIKGNKATIYSLGQEIWDTTAKKGEIITKTNIIKYKGKWISVNDNELDKDFETINGGQFETWDFKNKVFGTF